MIYTRPTFADLQTRIATDLAAMPDALREPLAAAWARACHGVHGHLDWVVLQTSPLTCELERLYDFAVLYNVPRLEATQAVGRVTVTGTAGATLLAGALARSQGGVDYTVLAAVTLGASGEAVAQVRSTVAGAATNLDAGQLLTLTTATAGVASSVRVTVDGITGGDDIEAVDDWRARVVDQWRTLVVDGARGGRPKDYVAWAKAAHPSVTGALVGLHELGIGSVVVRPICNDLANRLPTAAVLDAVRSYLAINAPGGDVRVVTPVVRSVPVSLSLSASVNTAVNQLAVAANLKALVATKQDALATITMAEIDEAVAAVTPFYSRLAPTVVSMCGVGEVFVLGNVAWS